MQSAIYAIARPFVTQVDQSKTVEVRIMQCAPYNGPIALVLGDNFHLEILIGSP